MISIWNLSTFKKLVSHKFLKKTNAIGLKLSSCEQFLTAAFSKDGVYLWKIIKKSNSKFKLNLIFHKNLDAPLVPEFSSNNSIIIVSDIKGKIWFLERDSGKEIKFIDLREADSHSAIFS